MLNRRLFQRCLVAAGLCLSASSVFASPITYDFTVNATTGPLTGQTSSGYFTYDDNLSSPGSLSAFSFGPGLLLDLAFTWNGINYDETSADTGGISFFSGAFAGVGFGTDCGPTGGCDTLLGAESWALNSFSSSGDFSYSTPGATDYHFGAVTLAQRVAVPEPTGLALTSLGLFALALSRKMRAKIDNV